MRAHVEEIEEEDNVEEEEYVEIEEEDDVEEEEFGKEVRFNPEVSEQNILRGTRDRRAPDRLGYANHISLKDKEKLGITPLKKEKEGLILTEIDYKIALAQQNAITAKLFQAEMKSYEQHKKQTPRRIKFKFP